MAENFAKKNKVTNASTFWKDSKRDVKHLLAATQLPNFRSYPYAVDSNSLSPALRAGSLPLAQKDKGIVKYDLMGLWLRLKLSRLSRDRDS